MASEKGFNGRITILCGELSGEIHAANLLKNLSKLVSVEFYALGSSLLRRENVKIVYDYKGISITGLGGVLRKIFPILRAYWAVKKHIKQKRPSVLILVDFPGLNLFFAKLAKKENIPVVYFIPPQIWAWGRRRIKIIKECVDLVISFFPFERSIYEAYGVRCEFVGHPYANSLAPSYEKEKFFEEFSIPKGNPIIALFPGSREEEVKRHMPYFRDLIKRLEELLSHPFFIFAKAQSVDEREIKKYIRSFPNVRIIENLSKDILFFSDFAILASGSATLEAALAGVPSVVIYRLSFISYHVAKFLVKVPYVSLPNILLGEEIFPEFIQNLDTQKIAVTIRDMLKRDMRKKMEEHRAKIRSLLTLPDGDPYRIASLKIVDLMREKYGSLPKVN